jgi:biotin operon repressor
MSARVPIALPKERQAISRLIVELAHIKRSAIFTNAGRTDARIGTAMLVYCAVVEGHAGGKPMGASKIATYLDLSRTTVLRQLDRLMELGIIIKSGRSYLLEPNFAASPPPELPVRYAKALKRAFDSLDTFIKVYGGR